MEKLKALFTFEKFFIPSILSFIYLLLVGVLFVIGMGVMIGGIGNYYINWFTVLVGLIISVIGPIVVRIIFEGIMLFYKIYERLKKLDEK